MYTANTMSSAIEAMGMSLTYDASYPAVSSAKERETFNAGQRCITEGLCNAARKPYIRAIEVIFH